MAEDFSYGFYDSVNGDRRYSSIDFSKIFNGIIRDGVFASEGSMMAVVAVNDQSYPMNIGVEPGRAWFNGTWTNVVTRQVLTVQTAPPTASRIDTVVLEINQTTSVRANSLKIIRGATAGSPVPATLPANEDGTAIADPDVHQYPLAYITVASGTTAITDSMIENAVLANGTSETPSGYPCTNYVTGILEVADISSFFNTWQGQFQDWEAGQQAQFTTWFNNIVEIIEEPLDGSITNAVALMKSVTDITFTVNGWTKVSGQDKWTQDASITPMTSTDQPIIQPKVPDNVDFDDYLSECGLVVLDTGTNKITATYHDSTKPTMALTFMVKGR